MTEKMTAVIGVDPGETTGVALLAFWDGGYVLHLATEIGYRQGPAGMVKQMLANAWGVDRDQLVISIERFVVRGRASRSSNPQAGEHARNIIGDLEGFAREQSYHCVIRTASQAKQWATDARLRRAGLYDATRSPGGHRRDACRHALMTGVTHLGWTDPLSRSFTPDPQ